MWEENLAAALDSLVELGVYIIKEDTHELLYYNRRVKEVSPQVQLGMRCHELWNGTCQDCPLKTIGAKNSSRSIHYDDPFGEVVDITADRTLWKGEIPAFIITVSPHKLNFEEEQGLEKIEKMYRQSLVTVFNECIIANLTEDFYVNCQKDTMWRDIPPRGHFSVENANYSRATVHPNDISEFDACFSRESMLRLFASGKNVISRRLRRMTEDGTYHMVEFTAAKIEDFSENECWCALVYRDINEAYLQERKMNTEIRKLATAARIAYQMLISINLTQNTYSFMNYSDFKSVKIEESGSLRILEKYAVNLVAPEHEEEFYQKFSAEALLQTFLKGENRVTAELKLSLNDESYHWNSIHAVHIDSSYIDDVQCILMVKNIDAERQLQEENLRKERKAKSLLGEALKKAEEASLAKSKFLSSMSHDIRTPMNAIMGMTALAQIHIDDTEKLKDYLKQIEISSGHLLGLINEVLDVSKIESGNIELEDTEFDLYSLAQEVVLMLQPVIQKKKQQLSVDFSESLHRNVSGDEPRLRQVLVNLLENASKYTGEFGTIQFSINEQKKEEQQLGKYQFVIEDNGIGMKEEYLQHIFEPFSRAADSRISKIAGTGLGLTITHSIVTMMGGEINVESKYGKGTRFTVTLFLDKKGERIKEMVEKPVNSLEADFSNLCILLVEDNLLNQEIALEMLKLLGAKVELAENGKEAVDMVKQKPAFYYDLVFMDIQMPIMDGCQAAELIRSSGKESIEELPIIAMTADAFMEDIKKTRLAGMDGHLVKPINMEELRQTLVQCMDWKHKNRG